MFYNCLWMRSHLNTSFIQTKKKKKKDILLPSTVPQLLLVNRSAVSFLEDDLPANLGGGASEQGGGCCCKHNAWSSTESWLSQQVKIGTNKGERQGNVTDLIAQVTTDTVKPANLLSTFSMLAYTSAAYVSTHYPREEKGNQMIFCWIQPKWVIHHFSLTC